MWTAVRALPFSFPFWFGGRASGDDESIRHGRIRFAALAGQPTETASDDPLVVGLRSGDVRALDAIVVAQSPGLIRYAASIVGSMDTAEDVVQDVFIKLWNARAELTLSGSLSAYLLRMTRNRALDVARHERAHARRAQEVVRGDQTVRNSGDSAVETDELSRMLRDAITSLPARSRDVFLMRRRAGLSSAEVAQALGITVPAVHVHLSRALRRIAQTMGRETK